MTHSPTLTQNINPLIRVYLGGSFDPVHLGHIQMAMAVYECLAPIASEQNRKLHLSLLPNARSPFKTDSIDPQHRLAMLKLALQGTPLCIDELELWQAPPVYTIDSVRTLRSRYPNDSLIFVMGMDSARSLDKWQDGLALINYVNIWVFNRVDSVLEAQLSTQQDSTQLLPTELQAQTSDSIQDLLTPLKNDSQGHIYIDLRPIASISSTQIRQVLSQSLTKAVRPITRLAPINDTIDTVNPISSPLLTKWLHPAVYHYIITHKLYSKT
nr:nicotinate-nicotinamide nucleotide adenylyltransferase [uncultured Psychrobacter sp.]